MDRRRFHTGVTRRRALTAMLGGATAGTLALLIRGDAVAAKVGICHHKKDGTWTYKRVPESQVQKHLLHGDFLGASRDECEGLNESG